MDGCWLQRPDSNRRPQGYGPRELPLLHSAVCPLRGIPSMQYARPKAYPSSRTVVEEAGFAPARRPRFRAGDGRLHYAARVCFRHSSIFPALHLQDG